MTAERWRRIGELFEAAVRIDSTERAAWLRDACGGDDELRTEVGRLLAQHERVDRGASLTPPQGFAGLTWRVCCRNEALPRGVGGGRRREYSRISAC